MSSKKKRSLEKKNSLNKTTKLKNIDKNPKSLKIISDNSNIKITRTKYRQNKKKRKIKKAFWIIIFIISIIVIIICLIMIFFWHKDNEKVAQIEDEIKKVVEEKEDPSAENVNPPENKSDDYWDFIKMDMLNVDFDTLKQKNSDTVAFIKVNGTNVNYPVVQTNDNKYYLTHAFDKTQNSAGWVFADYRDDMTSFGKNTIIYGHSRSNQTVFGSLKKVLNKRWYSNKNNHVIKLSTPASNTLWQIFSIYTINPESYYITTDFTDESYQEFLTTIKNRSQIDFSGTVNTNDKILTLSTCKDTKGTQRLVIHAKLIKQS